MCVCVCVCVCVCTHLTTFCFANSNRLCLYSSSGHRALCRPLDLSFQCAILPLRLFCAICLQVYQLARLDCHMLLLQILTCDRLQLSADLMSVHSLVANMLLTYRVSGAQLGNHAGSRVSIVQSWLPCSLLHVYGRKLWRVVEPSTVNFGYNDIGYNDISLITTLISCP